MKCSDMFVRCLEAEGVEDVFAGPGAANHVTGVAHGQLKQEVPTLIECPIDYSENAEVWNKELEKIICPLD